MSPLPPSGASGPAPPLPSSFLLSPSSAGPSPAPRVPSALRLPGTPPAAGGPSSSLPWPGRWEPLWGRGSSALGFPRPLASGKSALGEGTLLLASGQLVSWTKVQGRCLGPPADLYSPGSGFRPQRPREQPQVGVGTGRRHWRAVGETRISPRWLRTPGCGAVGRGSLDVSPLRAGCVCQAGAAWAQSPDKGPQPRRPSPVGSWWPEQSGVHAESAPRSSWS